MKTTSMPEENKRRTRFMIVDESQEIFSLMHDICARYEEVKIECYDSPQDAINAFDAEPEAFEFVLNDLEMPDMIGFELTRRLRPLAPALEILLSTWNELQSNEEAVEKGFCGQAHKPFPFVALRRAIAPVPVKNTKRFASVPNGFSLVPAY